MEFQIGLTEITVITCISASSKLLQVLFSFSMHRSLANFLLCKYILFKFALPFFLRRTYKRLIQPYRSFLRLSRYSETFLRTFITYMHIQSLPRSRDAATIVDNWSLTERRFRHLERTVLGRYLLSCHTVIHGGLRKRVIYDDDVIKWKHFPRYWPFMRGIHRSRCFLWSAPE